MDFKTSLDKYLTTEPDNGFQHWSELVLDLIPETTISADEWDKNEDFFFDGLDKLAQSGKDGFPVPDFAADVLISRFYLLKNNPHLKTWEEVQQFVNKQYLPPVK